MNILTQTQISAFERCRRLYYLKYIRKLVWPVEAANRRKIRAGDAFHLLVRQLILGLPRESLIIPPDDKDLKRWIGVFCQENPLGEPEWAAAEKEVSLLFAGVLWLGKFDALTLNGDRMTIFDWKTGSVPPDRMRYLRSPQTRLYRFLAASCASRLLGISLHAFPAENIEMVYWFPQYPDLAVRLPYSDQEYREDMTRFTMLSQEMMKGTEENYPRTEKPQQCVFCEYRTRCFPETAPRFAAEGIPEEEQFPEEIWQGELFPADNDREETTF